MRSRSWADHPQATNAAYAVNPRAPWPRDPLRTFTTTGLLIGALPPGRTRAAAAVGASLVDLWPASLILILGLVAGLVRVIRDGMKLTVLFSVAHHGTLVPITPWEGREGPAWDAARQARQVAVEIRRHLDEVGGAPGPNLSRQLADLDAVVWVFATASEPPGPTTTASMVALADSFRREVEEMGKQGPSA